MRTAEERLLLLHKRAWQLNRKKNQRMLAFSAIQTTVLLTLLLTLTVRFGNLQAGMNEIQYTGASLLGESAGGYVLVAVIAFAAGVVMTAVIKRYLKTYRSMAFDQEQGGGFRYSDGAGRRRL